VTEFCTALPNICGSPVGNLLRVNLLGLRNFEVVPRLFGNIVQAFETILNGTHPDVLLMTIKT